MQANGVGPDQITQVRGFADQDPRKPDEPLDPSNRRITLIVQYLGKAEGEKPASAGDLGELGHEADGKPSAGTPSTNEEKNKKD